jgi:galactokinase
MCLFAHVRCKSLETLHACREAKAGGFWAHVAGTAYKMIVEHLVAGLRIDNYWTTLPFKKGLSSSAAVCIAVRSTTELLDHAAYAAGGTERWQMNQSFRCMQQVARCFNQAYGLQLSVRGEMECAYQGERLTPSLCGRMVGKKSAAARPRGCCALQR